MTQKQEDDKVVHIRRWLVDKLVRLLERRGQLYKRFAKLKVELLEIRSEQLEINAAIETTKKQMEDAND